MSVTMTATQVTQKRTAKPTEYIWRLSVAQYHQMIRAGILTEDDPVELLEGWLVTKMPKNPPHIAILLTLRELLEKCLPSGWYVDTQDPLTTADSQPEPDAMVVRGHWRDYLERHPNPNEVELIVEVADSTLPQDRTIKKRLYARAKIPCYWIANIPDQQLEVYTQPTGTGDDADYARREVYSLSDDAPLVIDGIEAGRVAVHELFGS